jgi:hypothetical protein
MSSTFSQVSAVSVSVSSEPECEPSPSARSTPSVAESSPSTGPAFPAIPMSVNSPPIASEQMELPLMSSAVGSPARTFRKPVNLAASKLNGAVCGPNMLASFAKFDPASSLWKTSQLCLDGVLAEFSETWPRSGLMLGGVACELVTSEPPTSEIGFGLLPTPRATKRGPRKPQTAIESLRRRGRTKAHKLEDALVILEGRTGIPNPAYVAWMMGFDPAWTKLEPSATPSSRKSRKSSGGRS